MGNAFMALAPAITQLSSGGSGGGSSLPTIAITQDMLQPLIVGVVDNIGAILPLCLGLFTIFLGIRIIPSFISRFARF